MLVAKVLPDPLWRVLQHRHVFCRRRAQLGGSSSFRVEFDSENPS